MGPILVIGVGIVAIMWFMGWLTPARLKWIGAITALFVGFRVLAMGQPLVAAGLFALAAFTGWLAVKRPATVPDAILAARQLLGVGADADAAEINAAHRRLIAELHPDRGGDNGEASAINAARDLLLGQTAGPRRTN